MALGGSHPALRGEDDGDGIARQQVRLGERLRIVGGGDHAATLIAVFLGVGLDLALDERPQPRFGGENLLQALGFGTELALLRCELLLLRRAS